MELWYPLRQKGFLVEVALGFSRHPDPRRAAEVAVTEVLGRVKDPVLLFCFTTDNYDPNPLWKVAKELTRGAALVGVCSGGIILKEGLWEEGIGVCAIGGEGVRAVTALGTGLSKDPRALGRALGEELLGAGIEEGTLFLFPDGFSSGATEALRGLYEVMGPAFQYVGGCAGDNLRYFRTYQFTEKGIVSDGLAAALVGGLRIGTAVEHGWRPRGDYFVVTLARGKRVLEIEGSKAFEVYSRRLGEVSLEQFAAFGMRHPLGFPTLSGSFLIRDPWRANPDGSIDFASDVPFPALAHVMVSSPKEMVGAARTAAQRAKGDMAPGLALLFDCISRRLLLEGDFEKELGAIREVLGEGTPLMGILTFGEVGTVDGVPFLFNKSVALAVFEG